MDLPYSDKLADISTICDALYSEQFRDLFAKVSALYQRFQSASHPITDGELEVILTELPLQLFAVSERLADIKMRMSVTKLENKHKRVSLTSTYLSDLMYDNLSATARREAVNLRVDSELRDDEVAVLVYASLIDRIEGEMSFSRELIMGAKKLWDARRSASLPTAPTVSDLPDYPDERSTGYPPGVHLTPLTTSGKDYIKGDVNF